MNKDKILRDLASLIGQNKKQIIDHNKRDLANAADLDATLLDRLRVDEKKVNGMVNAIEEVIRIEDPENKLLDEYRHPNGMLVQNKVVPFGNILIIYESRPDVTIEAAISAFKAGNRIFLKGGKEAVFTNTFLVGLWHQALQQNNEDIGFVTYLNLNRQETQDLIEKNPYRIDLIIPRGGDGLIHYIKSNTSVPLLISGRGNNFVYVHEDADFDMAIDIIVNGKSRLSVCNATDKVLFHRNLPELDSKLSRLVSRLAAAQIHVLGTPEMNKKNEAIEPVENEAIFYEEFLAPKILFAAVDSLEEAIGKINQFSGGHSASIVCSDEQAAGTFQNKVDCAAVYHNASTRFTDGGEFGMGAEIAISTQKLHFRGPLGLSQLVTNKWFVYGNGQIR
ncbi:MAG: glutamate-5-semialdehyde dehydrogenase [Saprospiraceae bacterium]|nr:glutamate-5-semialdehyde dehydrogenase [Saprospiraceae bacterium]MCB9325214.1 glutamate-5-semialdehyde dehydrogenase [Lewinellaceae bacterium]